MKEKEKTDPIGAAFFLFIILCIGLFGANNGWQIYHNYHEYKQALSFTVEEIKNVSNMSLGTYRGYCYSDTMLAGVTVYQKDYSVEDMGKRGQFITYSTSEGVKPTIVAQNSDVLIVSHEVSHFVDYIVKAKGIHDTETRAYLQGFFTECVQNLMAESDGYIHVTLDQ